MEPAEALLTIFLAAATSRTLIAACDADAPEETPAQATLEAIAMVSPEDAALPPEDGEGAEPVSTPEDDSGERPESSNPGLGAFTK